MSEAPSEVYHRFPSQIKDIMSYGSQHPENIAFQERLLTRAKAKSFEIEPLHELVTLREESIDPSKQPEELYSYLGLADIESGTGNILGYEELLGENILSKSVVFYKGDIVFGRLRPYLNKVHLVRKEKAIGSGELYVITPKPERVDSEYLLRYLISDLTLTQTKWILTGNSYPRLGIEDFLNLSVVVPDPKTDIQKKIVNAVAGLESAALEESQKAMATMKEAYVIIPKLLNVIDIPQERNPDYYSVLPEDCDKRLDFNYNQPQYAELDRVLSKTEDITTFSEILDPERGLTNGIEKRQFSESGAPYLRVGDVAHGKLNLEDVARVDTTISNIGKDIGLEVGNLIISRSAILGIVLLVDEEFPTDLIISGDLIRVILKEELRGRRIRPRYVTHFLKSEIGQMQFRRSSHGAAIPKVNHEGISEMKVILPKEDVQKAIEEQVEARLSEASEAASKAKAAWAQSKKQFVDLLLN